MPEWGGESKMAEVHEETLCNLTFLLECFRNAVYIRNLLWSEVGFKGKRKATEIVSSLL